MSIAIVTDTEEVEISGSATSFRALRASLAEFLLAGRPTLEVGAEVVDPSPYTRALSRARFVLADGPTKVSIGGDALTIAASRENLQRFSSFLSFQDEEDGAHNHFEYTPGSVFISPDSLPIVIACRGAAA